MKIRICELIFGLFIILQVMPTPATAQDRPIIFVSDSDREAFLDRLEVDESVEAFVTVLQSNVDLYVLRHQTDPEWIVSRLQMYWHNKYKQVYVEGMDFSHGEGRAPVPTVRFSGSRDWATDYLVPDLEDIKPYLDDKRGLYLQNGKKDGQPWEWIHPAETGHIVEKINYKILSLAQDAAFLYWMYEEEKYGLFARDIFLCYMLGMYHRDPPQTVSPHRNADLMGLQTFEVIHESVVRPLTLCYDFLHKYLRQQSDDLDMMQSVFKKWADQEIKYGVPDNNWNLMQAGYITYLALALEGDEEYKDGKGQEFYLDQVLHQNSRKQKALHDVMNNFDPQTGIWPEVAGYSIMVSDDILEVFAMMDKSRNNYLLKDYPILEKAILANLNYLFPNGFTTAYGDAKHRRIRFNALELLIAQYRKYGDHEKESLVTGLLNRFIEMGAYERDVPESLFDLFFYVDELEDTVLTDFSDVVHPTFYSENVSWIVQRNGGAADEGMMVSTNASLGNHSHANGINIELFAKGMVVAPDAAAGVSYWSQDHREYYSRFPAHNTVVVDGKSNYGTMNSSIDFKLNSIYPHPDVDEMVGDVTYASVDFIEPSTEAKQHRLTSTIRTGNSSGYFVDIFHSSRIDKQDVKHEYILHGQGQPIQLLRADHSMLDTKPSDQLHSSHGDLIGYDYFNDKREIDWSEDFIALYQLPNINEERLSMKVWMKGFSARTIFTALAPPSRALSRESVPASLMGRPSPSLVVRQEGEAQSRPFVSIVEVLSEDDVDSIKSVNYFTSILKDPDFLGIEVTTASGHVDYIFSQHEASSISTFEDGLFNGKYGVVSKKDDHVTALFLGSGQELALGGYSIRSDDEKGSILILIEDNGLEVDTDVGFTLIVPDRPSNGNRQLMVSGGAKDGQLIEGKSIRSEERKGIEFVLSAGRAAYSW